MEISSNTSNIQPYGSQYGTKIASENERAKSVLTQKEPSRQEQLAESVVNRQKESTEVAIKAARKQDRINAEQREKVVEQMHEFVSSINTGLSFRFDKASGRDVVTIYEADTGDVIRQIPEEEILEVLRRLAKDQDHRSGLVMTKV